MPFYPICTILSHPLCERKKYRLSLSALDPLEVLVKTNAAVDARTSTTPGYTAMLRDHTKFGCIVDQLRLDEEALRK